MNGTPGTISRVIGGVSGCRIDIPDGRVTVEGTDDADASHDIRGLDGDADAGRVVVERSEDGILRVRLADPGPARLGWLRVDRRPRPVIHLRSPRTASDFVETVSGEIRIIGCRGTQEATTVAGDAVIEDADGRVAVRTVSGSIAIGGRSLAAQAGTTSGRVRVHADVLESLHVRSVSGQVGIAGKLQAGADHRIETLSGDVRVTTSHGLRLDARTISGRLTAGGDARRTSGGGSTELVVGDGSAVLHVTTVSGDILLASGGTRNTAPASADPMLDALEALARGDISVEEADRRLEVLHD
jgi:hypothetical protein